MSKITDQFTKWTAVYLLCTKDQALASLQLFVFSAVIPFGNRIVTRRADKGGEYTGEDFKAYCQEMGITQFAATNTPQQIGVSERVGRTLCAMVRCMRVGSGLQPFLWGEFMMAVSYIYSRIPHSALNMETPYKKLYGKDADLSHSQDHRRKGLRTHSKPKQARPHVVRRDSVRLQRDREQLLPRLEPKNASRGGEQERRFHRNTTKSASRDQTALAARRSRVTVVRFHRRHAGRQLRLDDDMLWGVQNYTSALDFGVDTPAGTSELFLPQQASPGVTSPGEASPAEISPGGVTPEGSSPPPAPTPAPGPPPTPVFAAPRATDGHADRGTVGVTPVVTRSRAASLLPVPVTTRYGGGRNNNRATLAELFEAGTLQRLSELELGPPCYTENIAHQAESASFNVEYAYVATNALGSFSGGGEHGTNPEHLRRGDSPPTSDALEGGFRQGDRESGKAWRVGVGTHHFRSKRTKRCRHPLGIQDPGRRSIQGPTSRATSPRDRLRRHLFPHVQALEYPDGTCNRRGAGLRGLHAGRANNISQR